MMWEHKEKPMYVIGKELRVDMRAEGEFKGIF